MLWFNSGASSTQVERQNLTNCQVFHLMFTNADSTKEIRMDLIPPFNLKKSSEQLMMFSLEVICLKQFDISCIVLWLPTLEAFVLIQ
jgi:hypothetical protein